MQVYRNSEINLFQGSFDFDAIFREKLYESNEDQDRALHICNLADVRKKFVNWQEKIPRVKPFYAFKCNNDENIIKLLAKLGAGFDCASQAEIEAVLKHGVTPERIIYANPAKPTSHIEYAAKTNTSLMTFDSIVELERIHQIYPTAQLVLRFRSDATKAVCGHGMKFGCDPKLEAPHLLQHAKKLGLNVIGIAFHVGSGCPEPLSYSKAIGMAREVFDNALAIGHRFTLIDIGGGFPGDTETDFGEYANSVNAALEEFFPEKEFKDLKIISEPGTYFVKSSSSIGVTVHCKNEIYDSSKKKVEHVKYYVNDSLHGSFSIIFFGYSVYPRVLSRSPSNGKLPKPLIDSCIWGASCSGSDKISDNFSLPNLEIGDILVYDNMGNYSLVLATNFNGLPMAKVLQFADYETMKILESTNELDRAAKRVNLSIK